MKQYIVSLSVGDNVDVLVNAYDEEQAFNIAQDLVHERYQILEDGQPMGLGYVFLNEVVEEIN